MATTSKEGMKVLRGLSQKKRQRRFIVRVVVDEVTQFDLGSTSYDDLYGEIRSSSKTELVKALQEWIKRMVEEHPFEAMIDRGDVNDYSR